MNRVFAATPALASSSTKRSLQMPQVPTVAESGIKGVDVVVWCGVFAKAD